MITFYPYNTIRYYDLEDTEREEKKSVYRKIIQNIPESLLMRCEEKKMEEFKGMYEFSKCLQKKPKSRFKVQIIKNEEEIQEFNSIFNRFVEDSQPLARTDSIPLDQLDSDKNFPPLARTDSIPVN